MSQVRININTSFSENKSAGIAAKYLNKGEISLRNGLELAISCLFSPLGSADDGATLAEVKARCEVSRTVFETYMRLALSRVDNYSYIEQSLDEKNETIKCTPNESGLKETVMANESCLHEEKVIPEKNHEQLEDDNDDEELYIDFDSEVF